ncbi:MAG TPA: FHA domain-containing protein, partial [Ktedonobacteraceae bacterium]
PGAASPGGQQQWDVPSSPDPWAQPQQGGSPWGQPGNQPAAPTAYGSGGGSGQSWSQPAQVADQWSQPVQPAPPSTPPGGNIPWQQQAPGQAQPGFGASPFENPDGDRTMLRSTGGSQGIGMVRIEEGKEPGRIYEVRKESLSIGRSRESDIFLEDLAVSRLHASIISLGNNNYALRDEGSANGTKVNGQPVNKYQPYPLQDGDHIGVGEHELVFQVYKSATSGVDIESMPTITVSSSAMADITYRTREDELLTAAAGDDFSTGFRPFMNGGDATVGSAVLPPAGTSSEISDDVPASVSVSVPKSSTPVNSAEQLKFTAFHPKEVTVETWNTLLVYAHIEPAVDAVSRDAERFKIELSGAPRKISAPATQLLLRETNITIVPECKGVAFNPKRFTFKWLEDWHRANFRFLAKQELSGSAGNGRINIFAGPLLVGTLKLALLFEEQDVLFPAKDRNTQVTESLYKQIFASYSHDDSLIVLTCRNVYKALGINIHIDIDTLRSGQLFSDALMRMIDAADIFQLFWSERSAKSAYVAQEWEYALRLNRGEGFVRPVYWEIPMAKPPEKLAPLHFAYLPAYTFAQPSLPHNY